MTGFWLDSIQTGRNALDHAQMRSVPCTNRTWTPSHNAERRRPLHFVTPDVLRSEGGIEEEASVRDGGSRWIHEYETN